MRGHDDRKAGRGTETRRRADALAAALALALTVACAPPPPPPPPPTPPAAAEGLKLVRAAFADLAGWGADDQAQALAAFVRSCTRIARLPQAGVFGADGTGAASGMPFGTGADWRRACEAALRMPVGAAAARAFFEAHFRPWRARGEGLVTGYYEAELRGARTRHGRYLWPILGPPPELVNVDLGSFREAWRGQRTAGRVEKGRLVPLPDRAAIETGALAGRGLELVWVDDPVDAFFLHVQGSGRVAMEDGSVVRLGYAATNGHPYVAIGGRLVARGALAREDVTMASIRAWLAAHPAEASAVMAENPSYVFFRVVAGDGPIGSEGVALTPGRSLAVDVRFVPLGVPVWLETADPRRGGDALRRLVVAQDTGTAIQGPVRGDLFWGWGADAAAAAGAMTSPGRLHLLLPLTVAPGS